MSGTSQCPHLEFAFDVKIARIKDDTIKMADIAGCCTTCGKAAVFRGLPFGVNWQHPTGSPDGQELRIPFVIDGDEVDEARPRISFGIDLGHEEGSR